jgi:thiol-disulfide isomerase/thioredoxin
MRWIVTWTLISFLFLTACNKTDTAPQSQVLTDIRDISVFDSKISNGVALAFFHASWCTKCKALRPEIEKASTDDRVKSVFFAEVNYEINEEIVKRYAISGFPTMVIFKNGMEVDRLNGSGFKTEEIVQRLLPHIQ